MTRTLDKTKVKKIINSLKRHPQGTYLSQIARETGLSKSTVNYILTKHLSDKLDEIITGDGGLFKIIKLKNFS